MVFAVSTVQINSPNSVAPGITLYQLRISGCEELGKQIGVLGKLCHTHFIHNIVFNNLPIVAQRNLSSEPFCKTWCEVTEVEHPFRTLGSLEGRFVVLKNDSLDIRLVQDRNC